MGDAAPKEVGGRWTFDPFHGDHHFHKQLREDFEFVLKTCDELKIKFAPSLIDFHWCHQGVVAEADANIVKGGRSDIVRDPARGEVFFDAVLDPLLEISLRYHDTIYAWELINEPEWVSEPRRRPARSNKNKTVTRDQMKAFIAEGARRINAKRLPDGRRAFRSTVGFAHWDAIETWDSAGLGVTLSQFHYYAPDSREIPKRAFFGESPCFIGEFATTFHHGANDLCPAETHRRERLPGRLFMVGQSDRRGDLMGRRSTGYHRLYQCLSDW